MTLITRKTDYATRVLLQLAMLPPGSWTTAQQIARQQSIPSRLMGQIVSILSKGELVLTKRGKGGGVRLARPACEISLMDVVETMQGPLSLNICVSDPGQCRLTATCPMVSAWAQCQEGLAEGLRRETLDRLASRGNNVAIV